MKYQRTSSGNYVINGQTFEQLVGSRAQVMHGTAYKTTGELKKSDLVQNKHGRIVSKSKHNLNKNPCKNHLLLKGYTAKKGKFGYVKTSKPSCGKTMGGTTDPSNAEAAPVTPTESMGGVVGVNNSMLAGTAAPFNGGSRGRKRGGLFLGGRSRRGHGKKTRRTRRRRGGSGLRSPLSPADF